MSLALDTKGTCRNTAIAEKYYGYHVSVVIANPQRPDGYNLMTPINHYGCGGGHRSPLPAKNAEQATAIQLASIVSPNGDADVLRMPTSLMPEGPLISVVLLLAEFRCRKENRSGGTSGPCRFSRTAGSLSTGQNWFTIPMEKRSRSTRHGGLPGRR